MFVRLDLEQIDFSIHEALADEGLFLYPFRICPNHELYAKTECYSMATEFKQEDIGGWDMCSEWNRKGLPRRA